MLKEYSISSNRRVSVHKLNDEFFIKIQEEDDSVLKTITLSAKRWIALITAEIELHYVRHKSHLGDNTYIESATGFKCIDIHQFISDSTTGHQTKESIVFNLSDWTTFKSIAHQINNDFPELTKTRICLHDSFYDLMN
jgi:hypothetical protein